MNEWHMAACMDCTPPLPMPFLDRHTRDTWAAAHIDGTDHRVLIYTEKK
jgi:hypothetical protein